MRAQRKFLAHALQHRRGLSHQSHLTQYAYSIRVASDTDPKDAIQKFDKGLDDILSFASDPVETLSKLSLADGLGDVLLGLAKLISRPSRNACSTLGSLAERLQDCKLCEENDHHRLAFLCLYNQEYVKASALWEMALIRNPRDILALRCAQHAYDNLGESRNVLGVVERVLPEWPTSAPGYSRVLAMHGYGLQANGKLPDAEETIGRALNISLDNVLATYSLVQGYERSCRPREGLRALKELEDTWIQQSPLRNALLEYRCIFRSQLGEYGIALHIHDSEMSSSYIIDTASLLWRLQLYGVPKDDASPTVTRETTKSTSRRGLLDVIGFTDSAEELEQQMPTITERFESLLSKNETFQEDCPKLAVHLAMVYSTLGRVEELNSLIEKLESACDTMCPATGVEEDEMLNLSGQSLDQNKRTVMQNISLPLCIALKHYANGDYDAAVQHMLPIRPVWHQLGVTHAKADVFELTLIVVLAKLAKVELNPDFDTQDAASVNRDEKEQFALRLARSLSCERVHSKKLCPQSWMLYAKVLHECGDSAYADSAYRRALDLGLGQGGNL